MWYQQHVSHTIDERGRCNVPDPKLAVKSFHFLASPPQVPTTRVHMHAGTYALASVANLHRFRNCMHHPPHIFAVFAPLSCYVLMNGKCFSHDAHLSFHFIFLVADHIVCLVNIPCMLYQCKWMLGLSLEVLTCSPSPCLVFCFINRLQCQGYNWEVQEGTCLWLVLWGPTVRGQCSGNSMSTCHMHEYYFEFK